MTNTTVVSTGAPVLALDNLHYAVHTLVADFDSRRAVEILDSLLGASLGCDPDTGYQESVDDAAEYAQELAEAEAFADVDASRAVDRDACLCRAAAAGMSADVPF